MRLLCAAALTIGVGLLAVHAQGTKDAPKADPARAEKFTKLQDKFKAEDAELLKKLKGVEDPAARRGVYNEAKELYALTAQKAVALAAENPKDETALDAAVFAIEKLVQFGQTGADLDKAIGVVTDHHLNSPKLKGVVLAMGQAGPAGQKLLKAVAEKGTDKPTKGLALYYLGTALAEQADDEADPKKGEALTTEAIGYLQKAAAEAPAEMVEDGEQLKKAADSLVTALKTLGVGKPAPDVTGTDLDGKKVKLSSYKGKVVLLDVWATWCPPCREMIPHEREMVKKLEKKPFVLVSVSVDAKKETLTEFLEKTPMPWSHWWDGQGGEVLKTFRVKAFPTLYLIDAKGVIRKKWVGSPANEALDKAVEELVKEAEGSKG